MKTWERVAYRERCGHCGLLLSRGTIAMKLTIHGVRKSRWRCGDCAEGDPPPDLPPLLERSEPIAHTFTPLRAAKPEWLPYRE